MRRGGFLGALTMPWLSKRMRRYRTGDLRVSSGDSIQMTSGFHRLPRAGVVGQDDYGSRCAMVGMGPL